MEDNTSYELSHFVKLCTSGNPSALELLAAPVVESTEEGDALRAMLPSFLAKKSVYDAFIGYSRNQEKKFRDNHLDRRWKYAEAHVRTLYQLLHLLKSGELKIGWESATLEELKQIKRGFKSQQDIYGRVFDLEAQCASAYETTSLPEKVDIEAIEKFLFSLYIP